MTFLRARQLLMNAAKEFQQINESLSHKEIEEKINEIKYLSMQKDIPRLSLRREILDLEKKLKGIQHIEEKLLVTKKEESNKVKSLKKQISKLKKEVKTGKDKELKKKILRLSHHLGDILAKDGTKKEIELLNELMRTVKPGKKSINKGIQKSENKNKTKKRVVKRKSVKRKSIKKNIAKKENEGYSLSTEKRVEIVMNRLKIIKHELEIDKQLGKGSPEWIATVNAKIKVLETNIEDLQKSHPKISWSISDFKKAEKKKELIDNGKFVPEEYSNIKHTILFDPIKNVNKKDLFEEKKVEEFKIAQDIIPEIKQNKVNINKTSLKPSFKTIKEQIIAELPLPPPPRKE